MTTTAATKRLAVTLCAGGAALLGLTGCSPTVTGCAIRHGYAVVVFEDGIGSNSHQYISSFRLNVRYGQQYISHWMITENIPLKPERNGDPYMVIRTYKVGNAIGCSVDELHTHW